MVNERIIVKPSEEDLYFKEKDRLLIEKLRTEAAKETEKSYISTHKNHCFRCGTRSLVEIDHKGISIDICVNEGCGSVHLDPGEMEKILEGENGVFKNVKSAVFLIFK